MIVDLFNVNQSIRKVFIINVVSFSQNAPFYKNVALLQKAKLLADKKDVEALKELSLTEVPLICL